MGSTLHGLSVMITYSPAGLLQEISAAGCRILFL